MAQKNGHPSHLKWDESRSYFVEIRRLFVLKNKFLMTQ